MVLKLYCLKDRLIDGYGPTFESANDQVALRQCRVMLARSPHVVPEDQMLYVLGEYDNETGCISAYPAPRQVIGFMGSTVPREVKHEDK